MAADDLNTILGFGFVVAMWKGDEYEERHSVINLVFFFGLLFAWNFIMFPSPGAPNAELPFRDGMRWLFPSMTASLVLIAMMGVVTITRCGAGAIPFAVAIGAYCFLQLPTYEAVYRIGNNYESYGELVKYLAFGKILCGALFYQLFPASLKRFSAITLPVRGAPVPRTTVPGAAIPTEMWWSQPGLKRAAGWVGLTLAAATLTAIVDALARKVL